MLQKPKPAPNARKRGQNRRKIQAGVRHPAVVVGSSADMANPHATKTGWAGQEFRRRPDHDEIMEAWRTRQIVRVMLLEKGFRKVPYEGSVTQCFQRS